MWWINGIRRVVYVFLPKKKHLPRWMLHLYYYSMITVSVGTFNTLLLHLLFDIAGSSLIESGYWKYGFPLLMLLLVFYASLLAWRPQYSFFYNIQMRKLWQLGRRMVHWKDRQGASDAPTTSSGKPLNPMPLVDKILILEILVYVSTRKGGILYMIDGHVIYTRHTSTVIDTWLAKDWFVRIGKGRFVNMYHLRRSKRSKYCLEPSPEVMEALRTVGNVDSRKRRKLMEVSDWFKEDLAQHELIREKLPLDCWKEEFRYE